MNRGGYQIIDLKDVALSSGVGKIIPGTYEKLEGTRKCILLSGLTLDDVEYRDIHINVRVKGTDYVGIVYYPSDSTGFLSLSVEIKDDDTVTVTKATNA